MKRMKTVYSGSHIQVRVEAGWEFVERVNCHGIVVVAAVFEDRAVLIEQYRRPVHARVIELPAGLVDGAGGPEETPVQAAARELHEETGFEAAHLEVVSAGPVSSGLSNESITFFVARDLKKTGPGGGDATEDIRVHEVPLNDADGWLAERHRQGRLIDPKVYAGLYFLNRSP